MVGEQGVGWLSLRTTTEKRKRQDQVAESRTDEVRITGGSFRKGPSTPGSAPPNTQRRRRRSCCLNCHCCPLRPACMHLLVVPHYCPCCPFENFLLLLHSSLTCLGCAGRAEGRTGVCRARAASVSALPITRPFDGHYRRLAHTSHIPCIRWLFFSASDLHARTRCPPPSSVQSLRTPCNMPSFDCPLPTSFCRAGKGRTFDSGDSPVLLLRRAARSMRSSA